MKKRTQRLLLLIFVVLLASCSGTAREPKFVNIRGVVFGTYYSISYYCPDGRNFQASVDSLFQAFNQSVSYYVPNSVISRINRGETDTVDAYFAQVLSRSLEIAQATDGAFDPTVSPLVNAWGFGFEKKQSMNKSRVDSLLQYVGWENVRLQGNRIVKAREGIQLDFNAIAKGYASDLIGHYLESKGIETYMVEIGGDLVAKGFKPDGNAWRIGLEKPAQDKDDPQDWDFLVEMHDKAVATSGNYRKYYEEGNQRYSHTIDPKTGYPVKHNLLSVSVFAADCMTADAMATAFMVMGFEKARAFVESHPDIEAFFIFSLDADKYETYATGGLNIIAREDL